MIEMEEVDNVIKKLIDSKGKNTPIFSEDVLSRIAYTARWILLSQPMLLELEVPVILCGDIHGQYIDLLHIFDLVGYPSEQNFLFLGDYVDRGKQSIEVITLLLCYKIKYPNGMFLLRGNHESCPQNRIYGFYDECKRRYSVKLWKNYSSCFNCLPIAAIIGDKILCMHGGLSPDLHQLNDINLISRPTEVHEEGIMSDLLWSDPGHHDGWEENAR